MATDFKPLLVFIAATLTHGCADGRSAPDSKDAASARNSADSALPSAQTTFAWDCGLTGYVVSSYRDQSLWLFLPRQTLQLTPSRTASGARFNDRTTSFWSKGEEAQLEMPGLKDSCVQLHAASIQEDAKLRGVDFRATGNEPGWLLEMGPDHILLETDYGESTYHFPSGAHEDNQKKQETIFRTATKTDTLVIRIRNSACTDTMSDEQASQTVVLQLNDRVLTGCGGPLH